MLAVTASGQLWANGANSDGELGDGTTTEHNTPELISSLSGVAQASEGTNFSLAVTSEGTAWAWGSNANGELGLGSTTNQHTPQQIKGLSKIIEVSAGVNHALALKSDGTVWSWGYNGHGQLGNGQTKTSTSPIQVPGLSGIVQVSAGQQFSMALKSDGTVWVWGANTNGKLGDGTTSDHYSPEEVKGLAGIQIVQVSAGHSFGAALAQNGTVYAWGANEHGQLGNSSTESLVPIQVAGVSGATQIATGVGTLAAVANSTLLVWGSNTYGQLGDGTTTDEHAPEQAGSFNQGTRTAFAEGANATFLVRDDGSVMAAGANGSGQLGDGTTTDRHSPESILQLQNVRSVAAGPNDTLALTTAGQLWASGANTNGELGDGTSTEHKTPELVSSQLKIMQAAEAGNYSLALKTDGTVMSWGANGSGQLGLGSTTEQHLPQQIKGLTGVTQVASSETTGMALESNGTVWAWGSDSNGQLGDGQTKTETSPHQIPGLTGIVQIAAGLHFCLALQSNGTIWAWGANASGQLGTGNTTENRSPVKVKGLTGIQIVQVTAGSSFAAALTESGTVYAWGSNGNGQLGSKSESTSTPTEVASISGVTQIAAGNATMAAIANGALKLWGSNSNGQLGDGTTTEQHTPEQIKTYDRGIFNNATYTYNGDGLRTTKTVDGNTEQFTWDSTTNSVPVMLAAGSVSYIYGPDGRPLEQMTGSENPIWYHHDQQGSTRLLTNNTGAVIGTATYNAYGQTTSATGTPAQLGYDGQYADSGDRTHLPTRTILRPCHCTVHDPRPSSVTVATAIWIHRRRSARPGRSRGLCPKATAAHYVSCIFTWPPCHDALMSASTSAEEANLEQDAILKIQP